ncbi:MAG: dihydrolipoyllysine-residue acetyltransferase [Steroidobacteraceae bacterium]
MTQILVPDIGDFHDVEVIDVLVKVGDTVAVETPLVTLETDKATMDVPSNAAGVVQSLAVKKGDRVSKGSIVVTLAAAASAAAAAPVAAAPKAPPVSQAPATATAAPIAAPAAAQVVSVVVPDIGDFHDVEVIDVLVKAGDAVAVDTPLVSLETEKATMDVPSSAAGVVQSVAIKKGDRVSKGSVVVTVLGTVVAAKSAPAPVAPAAAAKPAAPVPAPVAAPVAVTQPVAPRAIDEAGFAKAYAGPSVRRLARELGVDLGRVKGTAVKGRISHEDVKAWVKQALTSGVGQPAAPALPAVPVVDFAKFGPVDVKPLGRIQKISGARLHASWVNVPHVTQYEEADITDLEAERAKLKDAAAKTGVKLTPLAFILRASALALKEFPLFNASLDASGQNLVFKQYIHLGFAADTPNGLVVPVIRDADRKDVYDLARELASLSEKARAGKLSGAEMQGGTFTVSSLGGIGGTAFTPIINAPEVAILGVSRSSMKPLYRDGQFVPRLMLPLSLSYDHRVVDGAAGARFAAFLAQRLADVKSLLEAVP